MRNKDGGWFNQLKHKTNTNLKNVYLSMDVIDEEKS
jgi:hypothetical protein